MPPKRQASPVIEHAQALRALDQARTLLARPPQEVVDGEQLNRLEKALLDLKQEQKDSRAFVLAILADQPCPRVFFKPWISKSRLLALERAGKVSLIRKNGKVFLKPSVFFALFATLPENTTRPIG